MIKAQAIGPLRERVAIQQMTETKDAMLAAQQTWATLLTVWAEVRPASNSEMWRRQQIQSTSNWTVTIRYRTGITPQMRVVWNGRAFLIRGVDNSDMRKRFIELACEELEVTGATQLTGDVV
jgi:SPP1 family predicted phage head-tail adaptor